MENSRVGAYSIGNRIYMCEGELPQRLTSSFNSEGRRYRVAIPKMVRKCSFAWSVVSSRRRVRYHVEKVLPIVLSILLLTRLPQGISSGSAETETTDTPGQQQSTGAMTAEINGQHEPAALPPEGSSAAAAAAPPSGEAPVKSETTPAADAESNPPVAAAPAQPQTEGAAGQTPSLVAAGQETNPPDAVAGHHEETAAVDVEDIPPSPVAESSSSLEEQVAGNARTRQKKDDGSRGERTCEHGQCFFLADTAFVSAAHLLPPPPPFTPPSTPDGRAFRHAVELCRVSPFNLDTGKKFIYLMSSAVTYFQQSRVKCAIAYAHLFREEDIPIASEEVLDACAIALLRHSPDDCWTDAPDPHTVFLQGMPGTKLIEPPQEVINLAGQPVDEAADVRRRQFKRAERLTLTLFKFNLVSRCHWCPPYRRPRPSSRDAPEADLLPKHGYQGPKYEAWRRYLNTLNEEVTRDLRGLRFRGDSGSSSGNTTRREAHGTNAHRAPTRQRETAEGGKRHSRASPGGMRSRRDSGDLPVRGSWWERGRRSVRDGEEYAGQAGGYTGLGSIPAGAVFGGLTNPVSRYAALLAYLQSRYRFQPLKYEFEDIDPTFHHRGGNSSAVSSLQGGSASALRTTQTLTLQGIDEEDPLAEEMAEAQVIGEGRQFFTLEPSRGRAKRRRTRKQNSSCDLLPQDQAAEAAKAALGCGADCVDTGEDLNKILREGTQAPPSSFVDGSWTKNDGSVWSVRLPRRPTAESLQRAYLNQVVSACATSPIHLSEAQQFYFAQAATLHFFGRFYDKCLQAMDEMTLPLFMRAFSEESRVGRGGMAALRGFLPVPAPYSGADRLMVNCAAAGLVAGAMPTTSLSSTAAAAQAIASAAAAAGAPAWGAPTMKTRAALAASAFAYHQPGRGLMGRSKFTGRIPCWDLDSKRVPLNMSKSEFRAVVTSFTDLEIRSIPLADRRFMEEQLVPTVLRSLLAQKLPVRIFLGYNSPAARAFVLARYMRKRFRFDYPEEAGWATLPPETLSAEDQTIKAAEVAVNCGPTCTDTGQSIGGIIRNGLESYRRKRDTKRNAEAKGAGVAKNADTDEFRSEFEAEDATGLDDILKDTRRTAAQRDKEPTHAFVPILLPPLADAASASLLVERAVLWISVTSSLAVAFG